MTTTLKLFLILLPLVFTLSCGGGGGGGGNNGGGNNSGGGDALNPGLQGKFQFLAKNGLYLLDAETGTYTMVPNTDYESQDRFPGGEKGFYVSPVRNKSTEFLLLVPYLFVSHVLIQDYHGQYLQHFRVDGSIRRGSMSSDGQYIRLFREEGSVSSHPWFEVYTRDGALVDQRQIEERPVRWLNDNRIVYPWGRTFYFTYPASTVRDDSQYITLPDANGDDTLDGAIGSVAISPDETKIAFTIA
jgi:hypothetical protein